MSDRLLKKVGLRRRTNGQLTLRYEVRGLTSFVGLELVGRSVRRPDFRGSSRRVERALPRSNKERFGCQYWAWRR